MRRSRRHTQNTADHGRISDAVSIRQRPAYLVDRPFQGTGKATCCYGNGNSQVATLVEGGTRYDTLVEVERKDTKTAVTALIEHAHPSPNELRFMLRAPAMTSPGIGLWPHDWADKKPVPVPHPSGFEEFW